MTRRRSFSALAFVLALAGLAGGSPASAGTPHSLLHPTLTLGVAVPVANGVKVGQSGAEWALPGGARLSAEAGSELRVISAPLRLNLPGRGRVASYTVILASGQLKAHVPADGTSVVVVSAPRKTTVIVASGEAAVVAGAQIAVANAAGSTTVGVGSQAFHSVPPGMVETLGAGKRPLLPTPALAPTASVMLSYGEPVALGTLSWSQVPDARSYRVELRDETTKRVLARTETDATTLPAGFATLEPGAYSLTLAAVDAVGLESTEPTTRPLHVLGMKLPVGGFVDRAGVLRFPPGGTLEFGRVDGVEMTYGTLGAFAPAPPAVSLFRTEPSLLRFRAAGAASVHELWIMPRVAHAKVAFGTRAPSWPGAPLEISVRLDDVSGSTDWIEPKPRVLVGVEEVPVEFRRDAGGWRGVLPARRGKGPWVVRVEVEDQHGISLGRDFIEVAAAAGSAEDGAGS